jgi:hypothetical protein
MLPRVDEGTREKVTREFDDDGPAVCIAQITEEMRTENLEILDIARRCSRDVGEPADIMVGMCIFYRLLSAQAMRSLPEPASGETGWMAGNALPRVLPETREFIASEIGRMGTEAFTQERLDSMEHDNPELLQMAHLFASRRANYLGIMQGFALIYACFQAQAQSEAVRLH